MSATLLLDPARVPTTDPKAAPAPTLRIRPVPRSEPLTDDERSPGALRPDLATGVRVRPASRGAKGRRTAGRRPSEPGPAAGDAGPGRPLSDEPDGMPAVLLVPAAITTVVAPSLHKRPPGVAPQPAERSSGTAGAPGGPRSDERGGKSGGDATPHLTAEIVSVVAPGAATLDPPPPAGSRELRLAARRLLGTCVEVLAGFRPMAQLRPYCAPERFDAIASRLLRPAGPGRGHGATRWPVMTARPAGRPGRPVLPAPEERITVRRVQICDVMEGVAELAIVLARRNKVWAMAMRLERSRGRWQCMHLEVL